MRSVDQENGLLPDTAIDLKLYSSMSFSVMGTSVGCDNHCQIAVGNVQGAPYVLDRFLSLEDKEIALNIWRTL